MKTKKWIPSQCTWIFPIEMNFETALGSDRCEFKSWLPSTILGILMNQIRWLRNLNREAQDLWWWRRWTLLGDRLLGFCSYLCPLPAVQPWESSLTSLKFSIHKTGIIQYLPHRVRIKWDNGCKVHRSTWWTLKKCECLPLLLNKYGFIWLQMISSENF